MGPKEQLGYNAPSARARRVAHLPASGLMFLRGMLTEPPRAGMTATTRASEGIGRQVVISLDEGGEGGSEKVLRWLAAGGGLVAGYEVRFGRARVV